MRNFSRYFGMPNWFPLPRVDTAKSARKYMRNSYGGLKANTSDVTISLQMKKRTRRNVSYQIPYRCLWARSLTPPLTFGRNQIERSGIIKDLQ